VGSRLSTLDVAQAESNAIDAPASCAGAESIMEEDPA
jgi:hypothetical protein